MSGRSILIVEDDPGALDAFVPILTSHGYEVQLAVDAASGFLEIERSQPTVLLVDLRLPVVDGLEFLRRVRQDRRHAAVPAAVMTGDYLVDDRVTGELHALGAPLYFKPLWEEDLVGLVERLFERAANFYGPCEIVRSPERQE
jgi:DNA-binding response OmpR family regulator